MLTKRLNAKESTDDNNNNSNDCMFNMRQAKDADLKSARESAQIANDGLAALQVFTRNIMGCFDGT